MPRNTQFIQNLLMELNSLRMIEKTAQGQDLAICQMKIENILAFFKK